MADRYPLRPGTPNSQNPSAHAESDPLAELARLIGQTDPFASLGRGEPSAQPSQSQHEPRPSYDVDEPAPEENPGRPAWLRNLPPLEPEPQPSSYRPAPAETAHGQPAGWPPLAAGPARYDDVLYGQTAPQGGAHSQDAYQQDAYPQAEHPAGHHPAAQYGQEQYGQEKYGQDQYGQQYGQDQYAQQHYAQGQADHYERQYDQYAPDAYPYRDEDEEVAAPEQRKGGLVTVAVVLTLALVGTASAFAYRSYRSPTSGEPPIIRADSSPTKITPAGSADASNKINDRVAAGSERIVPREEQPVDVKTATGPRVVFPPLNQGGATPGTASAGPQPVAPAFQVVPGRSSNAAAAAAPPQQDDEPRRIRTTTIRGDGSTASTPATPPVAPVVPTTPPAAKRTSTTAPSPAAPTASNGPMQLTPGTAASQASDTRTRVASVQPTQPAPRSDAGGSFFVQVSSQKNEADAQNSYRALQSKYPSVLGSRSPVIKRADLGDKGVFYRAMVGPFATQSEATQFCGNLTNAGGNCVVPRN